MFNQYGNSCKSLAWVAGSRCNVGGGAYDVLKHGDGDGGKKNEKYLT